MCIKPFYFQIRTSQNIIQKPELLSAALCFYRNPLFPIRVDILKYVLAQATLVWGILGADLMEISKCTFWWHCKMLDKVLNRAKRRERHYITLCTLLYLTLPCRSLPPYNLTEYPDFSTCPNRPLLSHV